ncbi:hypothetical protein, partial [Crocosphaera sp.]|uniref:hypothetical protein n=1 Tax=Crocosphaera sp. TaxID=2729996 RepID=UPI003F1E6B0A
DLTIVRHSGELLDFSIVPSQTLQDVSKRVELAFNRYVKGDIKSQTNSTTKEVLAVRKGIPEAYALFEDERR